MKDIFQYQININLDAQNRKQLLKVIYDLRKLCLQHRKLLHNKIFIYKQHGSKHNRMMFH